MPVPAFGPVQPNVDFIGCTNQIIRKAGPAAGAEDRACITKRREHRFIPPTGVTKLHDIAPRGVKLAQNPTQSYFRKPVARRKLEQKAAHVVTENVGDQSEIPDEGFGALKSFDVSN